MRSNISFKSNQNSIDGTPTETYTTYCLASMPYYDMQATKNISLFKISHESWKVKILKHNDEV